LARNVSCSIVGMLKLEIDFLVAVSV
jgi:hypothetical protein